MFLWRGVQGVSEAERRLDDELAQIEDRADQEGISQRATLHKRAGDLCADFKGREKLAVSYYGKAIDGYIHSGMYEAAGVLCRKLIRFSPAVVRAHFTLAALAVLDRRVGDAAGEITSYVHAARRTRTERLAIPRLRFLARITEEPELRTALTEALLWLGDAAGAAEVQEGRAVIPAAQRSAKLTELVTTDPHELWEKAWIDTDVPADGRGKMIGDFALREDLPPPRPIDRER
jgi:hypothetical protein